VLVPRVYAVATEPNYWLKLTVTILACARIVTQLSQTLGHDGYAMRIFVLLAISPRVASSNTCGEL